MKIYLLCGLAFAGKSTLAKAIAQRTGAEIVSLDAINEGRGLHGGFGIAESEWAATHRAALANAEAAVSRGATVVVDDTNCYRFLRDDYRNLAAHLGAECVLVYVDTPLSMAIGRLHENEVSLVRQRVSEAILVDLSNRFQVPQPDEPHLTFTPGTEITTWIDAHVEPGGPPPVG